MGNAREFTGSDEYKLGDLSKEADQRIKDEMGKLRGKEDYELGDLSIVIDNMVKEAAAKYAGKETYEAGDLSKEIGKRAKSKALEFTGKGSYSFGDVSIELNKRRAEWITGYLGKEYEFGDLTKTAVSKFTGKDEYEFGDVSKKLGQMFFGNKQALMCLFTCSLADLLTAHLLAAWERAGPEEEGGVRKIAALRSTFFPPCWVVFRKHISFH